MEGRPVKVVGGARVKRGWKPKLSAGPFVGVEGQEELGGGERKHATVQIE